MIVEIAAASAASVLVLCGGAFALGVASHNRLMALDQRCEQAFADVDVQLRYRHDLLPNLVEVVRGYAQQESELFDRLIAARNEALRAVTMDQRIRAEQAITVHVGDIMSKCEKLPEARADSYFRDLRRELTDIEHKLAAARRFFNLAVGEFNASLKQFPANIVAARTSLKERPFYNLGAERGFVEEAPQVRFAA